jgi:hypothetical protein
MAMRGNVIRSVDDIMSMLLKQRKLRYSQLTDREKKDLYREAEQVARNTNRQGFWKTRLGQY